MIYSDSAVGIYSGERNENVSEASLQTVWDMLLGVQKGTSRNPERGLSGFWHEQAIGTARLASAVHGDKKISHNISSNNLEMDYQTIHAIFLKASFLQRMSL